MKILGLHCPYCGGTIKFDIDTGKKHCFCVHCGQQVILDDEVIRSEHVEIRRDEARIREADVKATIELERLRVYNQELEKFDKRKRFRSKLSIAWAIVMVLIIVTAVIVYNVTWESSAALAIGCGGGVVWLLIGEFGLWMPSMNDEKPEMSDLKMNNKK